MDTVRIFCYISGRFNTYRNRCMVDNIKITSGYPLGIVSIKDDKTKVFPKKVEFRPGMNILFGPNGCGKSTIIKTIAANAMTVRGWSSMNFGPLKMGLDKSDANVKKFIEKELGFKSNMKFDGPVYYHNDFDMSKYAGWKTDGSGIGQGLANAESYMVERMDNRMRSSGEAEMAIQGSTLVNLLNGSWAFDRERELNEVESRRSAWGELLDVQLEYANQTWLRGGAPTLLLDEPELHLSFETMEGLFTRILPKFIEKGYQVIIATHYPLAPFQFPDANIIGIDRDVKHYTDYIRKVVLNSK